MRKRAKKSNLRLRGKVWWADYVDANGNRVRTSTGTSDKKLAKEWLDKKRAESWREVELGETTVEEHAWADAVVRYLDELESEGRREGYTKSVIGRLVWLNKFMTTPGSDHQGDVLLSKIDAGTMRRIRDGLQTKGFAPGTIQQSLNLVRRITRRAASVEWGWLKTEAPKLTIAGARRRRERVLTAAEEQAFIEELPDYLQEITRFASVTGLRLNEILGMSWEHVDLEARTITLPPSMMKGRSRGHRQNKSFVRAITPAMEQIIRRQRGKNDTWVFTGPADEKMSSMNYRQGAWCGARKRAGLKDENEVTMHTFRHTFITRALQKLPVAVVAALVDDTVDAITANYDHTDTQDLAQYAAMLDPELVRAVK